jgi:DNA polymerase elongation subunit (family B)
MKIFDNVPRDDILFFIIEELNRLCSNSIPYKEFVITKAVGDTNNMAVVPYIDEKGVEKTKIGDYIVPLLPTDEKERLNQLKKKDALTDAEYYEKCLPAQVQLAEKMRQRGQIVQSGSRLEFLITDIENHGDKQYEKIENIDYFLNHSDVLTVDFFYYIKVAINSIDEVLNIAFAKNEQNGYKFKKDFILEQYNFRYKVRKKVLDEIKKMSKPTLVFC